MSIFLTGDIHGEQYSIKRLAAKRFDAKTPTPLTRDDYLTAARILSGTRNERLPYVIPLIRKAGIEIELALDAARKTMKDPETAALLDRAVRDYGVSIRVLEKLTGIDSVQLYRMRNGTSRYNAERAALIRDTLRQLVPEMDLGAAE